MKGEGGVLTARRRKGTVVTAARGGMSLHDPHPAGARGGSSTCPRRRPHLHLAGERAKGIGRQALEVAALRQAHTCSQSHRCVHR